MLFTIKYFTTDGGRNIAGFYVNVGTFLYELSVNLSVVRMENSVLYNDILFITEEGQPIKRDFYDHFEAIFADSNYIAIEDGANDGAQIIDYQLNVIYTLDFPIKKLIIANGDIYIWDNESCLNYSTGADFTGSPIDDAEKITNRYIFVRQNINTFAVLNLAFENTGLFIMCSSIEAAYNNFVCVSELIDTNINYYGKFGDIFILQI